jgi:NTP pyrophosphatase (non-canonical NTP hydrolase)
MSKERSELGELAIQCIEDSERWFGDLENDVVHSIPYNVLALCGEAGELANIIKKVERGSLKWGDATVRYEAVMEAVDVMIYLFNFFALCGADPKKAYDTKRAENELRFMEARQKRDAARRQRVAQNGEVVNG